MDIFEYPIDVKKLLRKKLSIKKELLAQNKVWLDKKIAILGGSTTNEIAAQLELFLLFYGIRSTIYQSEYGQYWEDAMFGNSELNNFQPDIIYIHTSWRNIKEFPSVCCDTDIVTKMLEDEYQYFEQMWNKIQEEYHCPIIQNNFDRPNFRLMGNRDIWDESGRSNFIFRLNQKFYTYAQSHNDFYINDIDYLSATLGLSAWGNPLYWHMYKYAMSMEAIPHLAKSIANIIKSIYGKNKKLIAVDLDNTLWGGVIGDDGIEGIKIGKETSDGQAYLEFQNYLKELKNIGVILAVNSKNDYENAIIGLNHSDNILKASDFVSIKANWESKDKNIIEISNELSLGIDSFVFVDDNPAERQIVSANLPDVAVPAMNHIEDYINILDYSGFFEVTKLSEEDKNKTQQYHAKAEAEKLKTSFLNYGDYLDSLEMKAIIHNFEPIYIQRITQLTNKTNQFNLTTFRYTEDEIQAMSQNKNYICLYGKLIDRFGDNGIVSVIIGEIKETKLHIKLWLMSCRVLKRDMEYAMMDTLINECKNKKIKEIYGYYIPTQKNKMVREFYGTMGFKKVNEDENGNTKWIYSILNSYKNKNQHITIL